MISERCFDIQLRANLRIEAHFAVDDAGEAHHHSLIEVGRGFGEHVLRYANFARGIVQFELQALSRRGAGAAASGLEIEHTCAGSSLAQDGREPLRRNVESGTRHIRRQD